MQGWSDQEISVLKKNYDNTPLKEFIHLLDNRTPGSARRKAIRLGLPTEGRGKKRMYTHNDLYFNVPNIENSYWAGFLAADGCIGRKNDVQVSLQIRDKEHLQKFIDAVGSTVPVREKISNGRPQCWANVSAAHGLIEALRVNYSLTPKKSLTLEPPKITNIDHIKSFLVGYIDGDGFIGNYFKKDKNTSQIHMGFLGTKNFVWWAGNILNKWAGKEEGSLMRPVINMYEYRVSCGTADKIIAELLTVDVPRLQRKWSRIPYYAS